MLLKIQESFKRSLLGKEIEQEFLEQITQTNIDAEERVEVYCNNVINNIRASLKQSFPTIRSIVGGQFFDSMCRYYILENPPSSGSLLFYGKELPEFLKTFEHTKRLYHLPEIAKFEWLIEESYYSEELPDLDISELQKIPPEQSGNLVLILKPTVKLLQADYRVDLFWKHFNLEEQDIDLNIIEYEKTFLLIKRKGFNVTFDNISKAEFGFLQDLSLGKKIIETLDNMSKYDIDLQQILSKYLTQGLFSNYELRRK